MYMPQVKKAWQGPKLIIMARGRAEEMVLAGCKIKNNPASTQNRNTGCQEPNNRCPGVCSTPGTS